MSEYAAYLEDFDPLKYANELVVSTNSVEDSNLDLTTSIKRLQFDLKDVEKRLQKSASENYTTLISELDTAEELHNTIQQIKPSLKQVNGSYARLETEILQPYNESSNLHSALRKIHQTSNLLRSSTYFIYLISRIEEIDKTDQELNKMPFKSLISLARLLNQVKIHLADSPFLKSLKLVRDYEPFQQLQTARVMDICNTHLKNLSLSYDVQSMLNLINALSIMSSESFYNQLQQLLSLKIAAAINLIIKNLNNTKNLDRVFAEVSASGKLVNQLERVMKSNKWQNANNTQDTQASTLTIYEKVNSVLQFGSSLGTLFWKDTAIGVEPKFKEIVTRGGPIARNLKQLKEEIRHLIEKAVLDSFDGDRGPECLEVRMMLNSVASLDNVR
ncbi:hypothetical protein KL933_002377 [Ogataea haglerorum]|uniref:Conserved oligomeric Golgi complex subunit 5 n=1 Tax=Ogataea haglerorum TaxID=1937702 RepID=A0AAN6I0D2_9ASCO|nr:hypothetical protein KL914_003377 [Ogataea haglerorum]KAG7727443.1 hypothetical protein KL933_002377 [Ogataea haglerorum]KAG7731281.1 hypothetical protein KL948_003561 [Ogataea haglerorum]KAG7757268.1 hypothetical protein KL947_002896 [Ogataea haglerorum]